MNGQTWNEAQPSNFMGYNVGGASQGRDIPLMPKEFYRGQYGLPAIYDYITKGTGLAQQNLMQAYRSAYAARAAGVAGSYGLQMDQLASEMAGQGLSGDLVRRMSAQQRGSSLQQLGQAKGEAAAGYYDQMAGLMKGTGTELAAAKQAEIEQLLAPIISKYSADAQVQAGKAAGRGSMFGAIAGGLLGAI